MHVPPAISIKRLTHCIKRLTTAERLEPGGAEHRLSDP